MEKTKNILKIVYCILAMLFFRWFASFIKMDETAAKIAVKITDVLFIIFIIRYTFALLTGSSPAPPGENKKTGPLTIPCPSYLCIDGKMRCSNCGGTGQIGIGQRTVMNTCVVCHGSKKVTCTTCYGKGRV